MQNIEKFMFDTIFDELEPILPEVAEEVQLTGSNDEDQHTTELEETLIKTYNDNDMAVSRQEGFDEGKKQGISETLTGIEKTSFDTLNAVLDELSIIHAGQKQANQEISNSATALALTIVRKIFPTLNEKTALDEVKSILLMVLGRLIDEPKIIIKVNPSSSNDLSAKLDQEYSSENSIVNFSIIADENVSQGNCKIEWSNGTAERNLDKLKHEIDDIIAQNSTIDLISLASTQEKDETVLDSPKTT
ncbi:MAG: FliH/SctL family protein [Pseudomonadota bacterium]|nr:FliH/SctL family protein [Pseudomonadota bacterium]